MQEYTKTILGSGTTTLIISNGEMEDIINIIKSLENFGLYGFFYKQPSC